MKFSIVCITFSLTFLSFGVVADVPNRFANGESISAAEFNENFSSLNAAIDNLESKDNVDNLFLVAKKVEIDNGFVEDPVYQNNSSNNVNLKAVVYKKTFAGSSLDFRLFANGDEVSVGETLTTLKPGASVVARLSNSQSGVAYVVLLMEDLH